MKQSAKFITVLSFILVTALLRLVFAYIPNFSPVAAMALFSGFYLKDKKIALLVPFVSMFLTDIILGFHSTMWAVYLSFAIAVGIGAMLPKANVKNLILASLSSSVIFYLITNFAVWLGSSFYPQNAAGLIECYVAGLPFFNYTLLGDITFTLSVFGLYAWVEKRFLAVA
ncbi:MAG: hypothetical protein D6707_09890 [Bacteroidetes bacterium]|nr:MAG: hypothetical protein D6707_09890 [Bacteroidota bacterium]